MKKSELELSFETWLTVEGLTTLNGYETEYIFAPPRKWRFDFAWVEQKVAVEVEGLTFGQVGRHQSVAGFVGDCEKYERALQMGWRVYRVPGQWVQQGYRVVWRPEVMVTLKGLLG